MQPHNGARRPRAASGLTVGKGGSGAWTIAAYSGNAERYGENDAMLVDAAKWQHRETTAAARRALKVVAETQSVAVRTLEQLYDQGQQVQQAAHGVHQIDANVQQAGRIVRFMARWCCTRTAARDPDADGESVSRSEAVQRERMEAVLASEHAAAGYAAKRKLVDAAGMGAATVPGRAADAGAGAAAAAAAEACRAQAWSGLVEAVPGPLGRERAAGRGSMPRLGEGLEDRDRGQLQAETARQDFYLDEIGKAVEGLRGLGLAMGQELEEQAPRVADLHHRAEKAGAGLRSVAASAAKLAGRAPRHAGGGSWRREQEAAAGAVARALVSAAPVAARHARR